MFPEFSSVLGVAEELSGELADLGALHLLAAVGEAKDDALEDLLLDIVQNTITVALGGAFLLGGRIGDSKALGEGRLVVLLDAAHFDELGRELAAHLDHGELARAVLGRLLQHSIYIINIVLIFRLAIRGRIHP